VIVRHGNARQLTLLKGSTRYTAVTIADGDRLVIDRCRGKCPKGYELEVEIITPELADIAHDGGLIESRGSFPRQEELEIAVRDGGIIDLRSMTADLVKATVQQGGRILTTARRTLAATVAHGGAITYWGDPRVTSSVEHGGVIGRGTAGDVDRLQKEFDAAVPVLPPVPAIPNPRRSSR
jgi:hypothetical protein